VPNYDSCFIELLRNATHLSTEKFRVNKIMYGINFKIWAKVRILMPHNLHEAVQRGIITKEEFMNNGPSKTTRLVGSSVPRGNNMERRNFHRGAMLNHQKRSTRNQRTSYKHPTQQLQRVPQQTCQLQQQHPMQQHQDTRP